ncbi:helix-turn-helix domain-containing protein [Aliarcobacter butzleri]|uniref:helix-turn-helix domain-containing protein n=1 Tax=Aliarcobacter butzleri TaxID=28197 RepID=UPI001EE13968|nr:helix-turn-helix domain-containing protein [Aliarcobacter butzleri]MCG3681995.1 helix-turn-helix domain-containing protein [Aliarcobacter butzleri]
MKQQNITQTGLAKMMNTSRIVIHKLLRKQPLTLQNLQSIANALSKRLNISLV